MLLSKSGLFILLTCTLHVAIGANYLMESFEASVELKASLDEQIDVYRNLLTEAAKDLGFLYTDLMADGVTEATTAYHGAYLSGCSGLSYGNGYEILRGFHQTIVDVQTDTDRLFLSVTRHLRDVNLKEDPEMFYYTHGQELAAINNRFMTEQSLVLATRWYSSVVAIEMAYEELFECIYQALYQ